MKLILVHVSPLSVLFYMKIHQKLYRFPQKQLITKRKTLVKMKLALVFN